MSLNVIQCKIKITYRIWPNFDASLLILFLSDSVSYMLKCGRILKQEVNKDLLHLTCLIHALQRLFEKVQSMFNELDILVKHCKINFIKSPNHKSDWKQYSDLTLPPQAIVTQWEIGLLQFCGLHSTLMHFKLLSMPCAPQIQILAPTLPTCNKSAEAQNHHKHLTSRQKFEIVRFLDGP